MNNLDKAIILATEVHAGQVDIGGNPYILHPLRVMCAVEEKTRNLTEKEREVILCSSVMHDVIEDYKGDKIFIRKSIQQKFGIKIYSIVDLLTRRENESWKDYILRINEYFYSIIIKVEDLDDNCDLSRLNRELTKKDYSQRDHYMRAIRFLETKEGKL